VHIYTKYKEDSAVKRVGAELDFFNEESLHSTAIGHYVARALGKVERL